MNLAWNYPLIPVVKNYDWGSHNKDSLIRRILHANKIPLEEESPIAELWIGAHLSSSSIIRESGEKLSDALEREPVHFLGCSLAEKNLRELPFLLKILDAEKPLSIQAHPDKRSAEELHKKDPVHYPDSNHKPEIAISLNRLYAMAGFREESKINADIQKILPLKKIITDSSLQKSYATLMRASYHEIQNIVQYILKEQSTLVKDANVQFKDAVKLILKLVDIYGDKDSGVLSPLFLNLISLDQHEAVYLKTNEPHAYIEGTILECMASSDNVVRAGLTAKFRDTETLLSMLSYHQGDISMVMEQSTQKGERVYVTDAEEFQVSILTPSVGLPVNFFINGPAVAVCANGRGIMQTSGAVVESLDVNMGDIFFIPGDLNERDIRIRFIETDECNFTIYAATTNMHF